MPTPTLRRFLLAAAAASLVPLTALAPGQSASAAGPACDRYDTVLRGQYTLIPLKNQAMLTQERCGYRFRAGQQHSRLTVTESNGGLLFRDTGTARWKSVGAPCEPRPAAQGVAAWCPVGDDVTPDNPMLLEIWPRLGNDHVDASTLPAKFQLAALVDAGDDVVLAGAGDDFVNGAAGRDKIRGGGGDDWLRGGRHNDDIDGGAGADKIVSQGGPDRVDGGPGRDSLYSGGGRDVVTSGDSGYDLVNCGPGRDRVVSDKGDKRVRCERVSTYVPQDDGGSGGDTGGTDGAGGDTGGTDGAGGDSGGSTGGDISPAEWGRGEIAFGDATTDLPKEPGKYPGYGPSKPYVHQIMIGGVVPLKDEAIINPVPNGYLFRAGQQHNDLTIEVVDGRLRFIDEGTLRWKYLPPECRAIAVPRGVGASCVLPTFFSASNPMLIEVWPRLGDDTMDTTALSTAFDVTFLGDWGDDTVSFGPGNNFFNGAQDEDLLHGGSGHDWIRGGSHDDVLHGGGGRDYMVGQDGNDTLYGGDGDDALYGSAHADRLYTGAGANRANCGSGSDSAWVLFADRVNSSCENVTRS